MFRKILNLVSAYKHKDYLCMIDNNRIGDSDGECGIIEIVATEDHWLTVRVKGRKKHVVPSEIHMPIECLVNRISRDYGIRTKRDGKGYVSVYEYVKSYRIYRDGKEINIFKTVNIMLDKIDEDVTSRREGINRVQRAFLGQEMHYDAFSGPEWKPLKVEEREYNRKS